MKSRLFKTIALTGVSLVMASHAQVCESAVLYNGNNTTGQMQEQGRTFPESPEWNANWGDFENMKSPYIRLSGQKSTAGDWKGALTFGTKPATVLGGNLSMSVRSTQNVKFGVWIESDNGVGKTFLTDIAANTTQKLNIPVSEIAPSAPFEFKKLWIGLFDVKSYQYTSLFVDDIALSCTGKASPATQGGTTQTTESTPSAQSYVFSGATANSAEQIVMWGDEPLPQTSAHYADTKRQDLLRTSSTNFVLNEAEHKQILAYLQNDSLTLEQVRNGWYKSLYLVDRNRLKDNVVANPKQIVLNARNTAAAFEMHTIPLLIANLDYSYAVCKDSLCNSTSLKNYHLLASGLPTSYTTSSKATFVYDPIFVATTRNNLPSVEICTTAKCQALAANSQVELEFPSAGIQKIRVKLNDGTTSIQQTFSLEVK